MRVAPRDYRLLNPTPDNIVFTFDDSLVDGATPPAYENQQNLGAWFNGYLAGLDAADTRTTASTADEKED
jgi:hypothetical protein